MRIVTGVEIGGLVPLIKCWQSHTSGPCPVQDFVGGVVSASGVVLVGV